MISFKKTMTAIRRLASWYAAKWTHPFWSLLIMLAATCACAVLLLLLGGNSMFLLMVWLAALALTLLGSISAIAAGFVHIFKRLYGRAVLYGFIGIFFIWTSLTASGTAAFLLMFTAKDDFIKRNGITPPANMKLKEPGEASGPNLSPSQKCDFQRSLIESLDNGETLDDSEICRLPALEKLMETEEGRKRLLNYLEASPNWTVFENEIDGIFASRNLIKPNGDIDTSVSHVAYLQSEEPQNIIQYSLRIYFGTPKRRFAANKKSSVKRDKQGYWEANTWIKAGDAAIYISEMSRKPGRPMTKRMLHIFEQELANISIDAQGREGTMQIELNNGFQGGIYNMDIWCNPGSSGKLSVRAFEITKNIELSSRRMNMASVRTYGDNSSKVYFSSIAFTIYEGDWEQFYGAKIELWFTPDNDEPRKLWEGNYKVQGWMR